jgi:ribose 5-phosphate isomerase A
MSVCGGRKKASGGHDGGRGRRTVEARGGATRACSRRARHEARPRLRHNRASLRRSRRRQSRGRSRRPLATAAQAKARGIPLATLDELPELDLTVDGADEVDPELRLIKGGGGALLREKIVAAASRRMVVIADATKLVSRLGAFPLPVEVVPFGLAATRRHIERAFADLSLAGPIRLRGEAAPFVTDGGHYILDCSLGAIFDPERLAEALSRIPGVVEHGLFIDYARLAIIAGAAGVEVLDRPA